MNKCARAHSGFRQAIARLDAAGDKLAAARRRGEGVIAAVAEVKRANVKLTSVVKGVSRHCGPYAK